MNVAELRYSAWGETRYTSGTTPTVRQYTGQVNDGDTGLYYYNARYYDPALHRFIQADTIVPDPSDPQTLNRYAYVNNNPIKYTEPTGHDLMIVTGANTDETWNDIVHWEEWIKNYLMLSNEAWINFKKAYDALENQVDKENYLGNRGIRMFDWTQCNCSSWRGDNSSSASIAWGLENLEKEMEGMTDITLIGMSKGGNLVLHYANGGALNNANISSIISISAPQYNGLAHVFANTQIVDSVPAASERNFYVVNIYNPEDYPGADGPLGEVANALNIVNHRPSGSEHSVHNELARPVYLALYALEIAGVEQ